MLGKFKSFLGLSPKISEVHVYNELSKMSKESVWFFSQMKSGTTYTVIFLINYLSLLKKESPSKSQLSSILPYFHSLENRLLESYSLNSIMDKQKSLFSGNLDSYVLHTHNNFESHSEKTVIITRNPLDYLVSSYFYHYVNRNNSILLNDCYKQILKLYIEVYEYQENIISDKSKKSLKLVYENLIPNPEFYFKELVNFIGLSYDAKILEEAILLSSKDNVKKIEDQKGSAIIAPPSYNAKSFIRSGKIGDWQEYMDDKLKNEVINFLNLSGVKTEEFIYG